MDMPILRRGSLVGEGLDAPPVGERFVELAALAGGAMVELIVSSDAPEPLEYSQDHDELVVLFAGTAAVEVAGEVVDLAVGDWLMIPAGMAHRVTRTDAGTRWLAIHGPQVVRPAD